MAICGPEDHFLLFETKTIRLILLQLTHCLSLTWDPCTTLRHSYSKSHTCFLLPTAFRQASLIFGVLLYPPFRSILSSFDPT